jgi:hypothetical protein
METDPVSEPLFFLVFRIPDDGQSPETPVILSVTYHRHNPLVSIQLCFMALANPNDLLIRARHVELDTHNHELS